MTSTAATSLDPFNAPGALNASTPTTSTGGRTQLKMTTAGKAADAARKQADSPVDGAQRKPPAQKAWTQGTNPITQRPSNVNTSNGVVTTPKPSQATQNFTTSGETASPLKHMNDRMMFLLANLTGLPGNITLKNGEKYTGVLSGTSLDPTEMRYVFKMVKRIQLASDAQVNGTVDLSDEYIGVGDSHVMAFDIGDVADFSVANVVLDKTQARTQNGLSSSFRTDADISGASLSIRERNLQRWEPSSDDAVNMSLEDSGKGWDQFETNKQLFGVTSNYDESFYTTTIDRNNPLYHERAARAERIAREIEGTAALNAHVSEERGHNVADDKGIDEEEKYSGVRRDFPPLSSGQPNKYTPPARRLPTGQATVPGVPVDPAIISSQIARPGSTSAKPPTQADAPPAERLPSPEPKKVEEALKTETQAPVPEAPKLVPSKSDVNASATKPVTETNSKPSAALKPAAGSTTAPRKVSRPDNATANVEHDLLDSFKQFSAAEKLRVTERQRTMARESKAVKLNDLKKFSQNFKLHTPVPTDLVPILAKDETKQAEIVQKALKAVEESKVVTPKTTPTAADPKAARTISAKADAGHTSPTATTDRQAAQRQRSAQNNYNSASLRGTDRGGQNQNMNQAPPRSGLLSTRLQLNQQQHKAGAMQYNNIPHPIPVQDMRIPPPTGPSASSSGVQTPTSSVSTRFNVRAPDFKPNPAASTFQPGGNPGGNPSTHSSPRPQSATKPEPRKASTSFFGPQKPTVEPFPFEEMFNPIKRMKREAQDQGKTRQFAENGGIPEAYRTPPTWDFPEANKDKSYADVFEKNPLPQPVSAPQTVLANGPIPHQHQLPPHLQQGHQNVPHTHQTPHHTPRHPHVQPHHGHGAPQFEGHQMQFSQSTSSVHPSPRAMSGYIYNAQPQTMQGFPQQPPMQVYGMSPGVQPVALRQQGPQFVNAPAPTMGGHMMTNSPSNGPFMAMPTNPQMQMYSPAPGPAFPHYPGQMPGPPGANGFPSPRPGGAQMMTHQGSQQGHQPQQMIYMQPGQQVPPMYAGQMPTGPMTPMRGPYPQAHQPHYGSPHQHHPFPQQPHRGTPSGSYSQPMVQQHSMPPQGPPTGPASHGPEGNDEVK